MAVGPRVHDQLCVTKGDQHRRRRACLVHEAGTKLVNMYELPVAPAEAPQQRGPRHGVKPSGEDVIQPMLNSSAQRGKLTERGRRRSLQTWRGSGVVLKSLHHYAPPAPVLASQQRRQGLTLPLEGLDLRVVDHDGEVIPMNGGAVIVHSHCQRVADGGAEDMVASAVAAKVRLERRRLSDNFVQHTLKSWTLRDGGGCSRREGRRPGA